MAKDHWQKCIDVKSASGIAARQGRDAVCNAARRSTRKSPTAFGVDAQNDPNPAASDLVLQPILYFEPTDPLELALIIRHDNHIRRERLRGDQKVISPNWGPRSL